MKKTILSLAGTASLMVNLAGSAFAQANDIINLKPTTGQWVNMANLDIGSMLSAIVQLIMVVAALAFFFMLVIGGVQWLVSGGDKAGTEGAKNRITAALIGLVIVFSAWAITSLIEKFFDIHILNVNIPTI